MGVSDFPYNRCKPEGNHYSKCSTSLFEQSLVQVLELVLRRSRAVESEVPSSDSNSDS